MTHAIVLIEAERDTAFRSPATTTRAELSEYMALWRRPTLVTAGSKTSP